MSNIKHGTSSGNANNSKALSESFCCISIICELNESKKKTYLFFLALWTPFN